MVPQYMGPFTAHMQDRLVKIIDLQHIARAQSTNLMNRVVQFPVKRARRDGH